MRQHPRLIALILGMFLILAPLAACQTDDDDVAATNGDEEEASGIRIAVLLPGLADDGTWNEFAHDGLMRLQDEGAEVAYTERVTQDQQLEVFRNYAQDEYDIVIGHGGEYMDAALEAGSEFPDVQFVVTNGDRSSENVTSYAFDYGDAGYMAGVLAGLMTETNVIAMVAGEGIPIVQDALEGFEAGAQSVNPDVEVLHTITGAWADVDRAREASIALIAQGADVLWQVLDAADAGVFAAADDEGVMAIGLMSDQSALGPESHIGAAFFPPADLIYGIGTGEFELDGGVHYMGVSEGIVSVGAFADRVPEEVREKVQEVEDDLREGRIEF